MPPGSRPCCWKYSLAGASSTLVWLHHHSHWALTEDRDAKLAVFCTGPAIRNLSLNLVCEVIGTFVLVFGALYLAAPNVAGPDNSKGGLGALDALPVALLVLVVQVAVALSAVRVARGLLDLVEGAARTLAGPQTAAVPAGAHSFSLLDSDRVPGDRLVLSGGARAPPVSFPAV